MKFRFGRNPSELATSASSRGTRTPFYKRMSLTTRMFVLVGLAVLPALAIQAYNEFQLRASREADIRQQVVQTTQQFGEEMGELREGANQLLVALGRLPAVSQADTTACNPLFAGMKENFKNYSFLGAARANGEVYCASGPTSLSSVADQEF